MDKSTKDAWTGKKGELSPEALEKRKKINKKIFKFGCLPIIGLFILIAILTKSGSDKSREDKSTETTANESSKFINGLNPVDVYLNMEKQGFKTDKQLGSEYGNTWTNTKSYAGIDYNVVTFSSNIENVESVRATAMIDVTAKKIVATKQFIQFVATLPYENAKPEEAANWVDKNFDNDKANTTIGSAKLTIYAPSVALRMLTIERAK
jgi:hypothetical protein